MSVFVLCIDHRGNPASLIVGKAYATVEASCAEERGLLRVFDEDVSGPDGYHYAASTFTAVELPDIAKRALSATAR